MDDRRLTTPTSTTALAGVRAIRPAAALLCAGALLLAAAADDPGVLRGGARNGPHPPPSHDHRHVAARGTDRRGPAGLRRRGLHVARTDRGHPPDGERPPTPGPEPGAEPAHASAMTGLTRTSSEYVRELIRRDRDRQRLRGLLLDGGQSRPTLTADGGYFDGLRERARGRTGDVNGKRVVGTVPLHCAGCTSCPAPAEYAGGPSTTCGRAMAGGSLRPGCRAPREQRRPGTSTGWSRPAWRRRQSRPAGIRRG